MHVRSVQPRGVDRATKTAFDVALRARLYQSMAVNGSPCVARCLLLRNHGGTIRPLPLPTVRKLPISHGLVIKYEAYQQWGFSVLSLVVGTVCRMKSQELGTWCLVLEQRG